MRRRVFVSYARGDERLARDLFVDGFGGFELVGWMDQSDLAAGDAIVEKIRESLEQSSVMVVLVSERSLKNHWVQFEVGAAVGMGRPIIPIIVGQPGVEHSLPDWLRDMTYIDARGKNTEDVVREVTRVLTS
jgi:hypothetical protein